ncbi:DUF6175 family protein [Tenacibaculum finnmarkense]|uniref:DUF6175 family protein n=1 Tax=Tenacibaculum finnmarkense TaxID=2781243 RepID=UPI00187BB773|nr:DUF6175 family protein [Tenacibaculum finnmarkense]MBE7693222.1 hypothetical protein [Tenacibaculum finnmarkense genomovar finnmarkense]MCD8403243.1 DUF6175 family protein [Tenacibaculum finnmarkense genomovar finnmarkense]MCD8411780.1 DUF6175 family protein [Tenacibaculum finnmarkense genomovar ulcerans]MCD8454582.1 DUF6175 family protein [Tenacibaculum finnmarkense genomovar ulcerans]MCG8206567.1 hypothetical protein [Tenacibaculum finnmarkense genomovar finnmarkense]
MRKNTIAFIGVLILFIATSFSQAKKPTIMVVPSDVWCNQNGYMLRFNNQGTMVKVPDYKRAFQENAEVLQVISQINGMMAERGFPLKNMESAIKTLEANAAEDNMRSSKETGSGVSESPMDALKKIAKADIIMQLTWTVNRTGPKKSINFNLQGLDAYTDKQVATATGTGAPSFSATTPVLLSEAVLSHLDNFNASLQTHFDDMFANGREIIIRVQKWDDWDGDLESEYEDEELGTIIEDWLAENAVKGRFSTADMTADMALFEQVRIPLFNAKGRAIDARRFVKKLSKKLKKAPYLIPNKLVMKGLGRATIILGGK